MATAELDGVSVAAGGSAASLAAPRPVWQRRPYLTLAVIVAFGALLRLYRLGERSFWFDEAFFWRLSQFPLVDVLKRTAADNYPPLYPLLLKAWSMAFGCSALALRSLSALCGAATIVGAYLFCAEAAYDERAPRRPVAPSRVIGTGLFGAALVAASVFQIRWSWDVKMYTLGAMLSVYSSWCLLRALRTRAMFAWLGYAAFALAFLLTHYYALFSVFAQGAFAAVTFLRNSSWNPLRAIGDGACRGWLLSLALMSIGFAPWLPTLIRQHDRDRAVGLRPPVTLQKAAETPFGMFCEPEDARPGDAASFSVLLLSEIALIAMLVPPSGAGCYTFLAATAPFALGVAVSLGDTNVFEVRYLVFAQPFWLFAGALAIARVPWPTWRRVLGALLIGCLVFSYARFWRRAEFSARPGARAAAEFLQRSRRHGEPVVVCSQLYFYPIVYHSTDPSGLRLFDDEDKVRRHCWGSAIIQPHELISLAECETLECHRIWVVDMVGGWGSLRVPRCRSWNLASERTFRGTWDFEGDYLVREYTTARSPSGGG